MPSGVPRRPRLGICFEVTPNHIMQLPPSSSKTSKREKSHDTKLSHVELDSKGEYPPFQLFLDTAQRGGPVVGDTAFPQESVEPLRLDRPCHAQRRCRRVVAERLALPLIGDTKSEERIVIVGAPDGAVGESRPY